MFPPWFKSKPMEDLAKELIRLLKKNHPELKVMLVSNYEDAQEAAVSAGALPGFGKREIGTDKVRDLLRDALCAD